MPNRRHVVKSFGSLAGISTLGTISGSANTGVASEEIGIDDQIDSLVSEAKHDELINLLNKNDVVYSSNRKNLSDGSTDTGSNGGSITPQWNFKKDTIRSTLIQKSSVDDIWTAIGFVSFDPDKYESSVGTPNKVNDGCAIVLPTNEWTVLNADSDDVTYSNANEYLKMEHEELNPNYGACATADYSLAQPAVYCNAAMSIDITRDESTGNDNAPVQFAYEHTYALFGGTGPTSVSLQMGALSVELPLGAKTAWRHEVDHK